jgi:hypothetical protein
MAKAKFKTPLVGNINAIVTIDVSIQKGVEPVAEAMGIGKEEQDNLCGQKLSEIIQLLGNDEEI